MENKAIINDKVVELTQEEVDKAAEFHKARIAFGDAYGQLRFNKDPLDDRDHQHWICEDYKMSIDEFETIIRGYMVEGEIYIYIGSQFRSVAKHKINMSMLLKILEVYKENFNKNEVDIYNGVVVGKVGERWLPKEKLLTVKV